MTEKYRLHNLHAIRGWAALFVVIGHSKYPFWSGGTEYIEQHPVNSWNIFDYLVFSIDMFSSFPKVFVIMFFVLSGFFIARSLEKKSYTPQFFYGDRVIRIYIPYLGSLMLSYIFIKFSFFINPELLSIVTDNDFNNEIILAYNNLSINTFLKAILFLPGEKYNYFGGNNPYWSLYYEALFYIFIPFIILYFKQYVFFAIAVILYILSTFYNAGVITFISFFTDFMIFFAAGVTLFEITNQKNTRYQLIKFIRKHTNIIIILSALFLLISIPIGILRYEKIAFIMGMLGSILVICWILYSSKTKLQKIVYKLVINKFSSFLGKISFSMYLIHVPFFIFLYSILVKYTGEIVFYDRIYWFAILPALLLGYIFYEIFEKNSLILLAKYKKLYKKKDK